MADSFVHKAIENFTLLGAHGVLVSWTLPCHALLLKIPRTAEAPQKGLHFITKP
jgi:hypothetical protein